MLREGKVSRPPTNGAKEMGSLISHRRGQRRYPARSPGDLPHAAALREVDQHQAPIPEAHGPAAGPTRRKESYSREKRSAQIDAGRKG